jgi:hypothetical protein
LDTFGTVYVLREVPDRVSSRLRYPFALKVSTVTTVPNLPLLVVVLVRAESLYDIETSSSKNPPRRGPLLVPETGRPAWSHVRKLVVAVPPAVTSSIPDKRR